ncbi:hypothetical protein TNCV_780021 [Trichonephila clavipes]|nr:hypothetical protein TNCV_780021 [Trichonephila clavipes]
MGIESIFDNPFRLHEAFGDGPRTHGQVTWTTPEPPPSHHHTPTGGRLALDRFNVIAALHGGSLVVLHDMPAMVGIPNHWATAALEHPGDGQKPLTSLPLPPTSREDLLLDGYLEYPPCPKGTIHLQPSMSSPGFEPRPKGTAASVPNAYIGWAADYTF